MDNHATVKKFIVLSQLLRIIPYSASHIWRLERSGQFPQRVRLGPNKVAWLKSEVTDWVESKLAARTDRTNCNNCGNLK